MLITRVFFVVVMFLSFVVHVHGQMASPLSQGNWIRLSVTESGVYRIDYRWLSMTSISPDQIDPRSIKIYSASVGMLSQPNHVSDTCQLQELAIWVEGEADGIFHHEDYFLFYAQNPDKDWYDVDKNIFHYDNHIYTDKNFYFITVSNGKGKRMMSRSSIEGAYPVVNVYNDFVYHEVDMHNLLSSGRQWFGEKFEPNSEQVLSWHIPGVMNGYPMSIISHVMAASKAASSFKLYFNNVLLLQQHVSPVSGDLYGLRGREVKDTLYTTFSSSNANDIQKARYTYESSGDGGAKGYLDFILLSLWRELALYDRQIRFRSSQSLAQPISTFGISSFPLQGFIWDVTDPFNCVRQEYQIENGVASYAVSTDALLTFVAGGEQMFLTPIYEGDVANQNLCNSEAVDLLIVTNKDFEEEANRLSAHRQAYNGLKTLVVNTESIYLDYAGGKEDPTAIRNFAKLLFVKGLKNLLLFGKCSYDYKNRLSHDTNFVPTYLSRNSLDPLATYSSDDYFTFFDPHEGIWQETSDAPSHSMDIGVGRLPVTSREEAKIIVDKLIAYDTEKERKGPWSKEILFVADDGDGNLHQEDAEILAQFIDNQKSDFEIQKIYLDAFEQITEFGRQISPSAREALQRAIARGVLIVNFTGHGSNSVWTEERILDEAFIATWPASHAYPFFVTATCEFGRHDSPIISSGETALLRKGAGVIGLVTAARPVNSSTNALLNRAFYESLLLERHDGTADVGTLFRETKNNNLVAKRIPNRNFSLLGDPSMHLAIPENRLVLTSIQTTDGSTILQPLSKVLLEGEVRRNGVKLSDFEGVVHITVLDKPLLTKTLGDAKEGGITFVYEDRSNVLFRGDASVRAGFFRSEFIVPKNTTVDMGRGKITFYAVDEERQRDALGGNTDFTVGGFVNAYEIDHTAPSVQLYLGDRTFVEGGVTMPNTEFIAVLNDQSGINTATYKDGDGLFVTLDDEITIDATPYYVAQKDNYMSGSITLPLYDLSLGNHMLVLKVSDTHHNVTTASISFTVAKDEKIRIHSLANYPNPFIDATVIRFTHNRLTDNIKATLVIYNQNGQIAETVTYNVAASNYLVTLPIFDRREKKLSSGIYVVELILSALSDGSKTQKATKMIIID